MNFILGILVVESVSPAPRLEMFARRQRLGWDTWGNEALEHVGLGAYGCDDLTTRELPLTV